MSRVLGIEEELEQNPEASNNREPFSHLGLKGQGRKGLSICRERTKIERVDRQDLEP